MGPLGINVEALGLKNVESDSNGDILKLDKEDHVYIFSDNDTPDNSDDDELIQLTDAWSSGKVKFDSYSDNFKREPVYVESFDGKFLLAVKETSTESWGNQTYEYENYFVYEVEKDGTFDFNGDWVDNLDSYEVQFNEDFNSDEVIGFDSSLLSQIKTDTFGVELWRTSNSLYIIDKNGTDDVADDLTIQILDEGGRNPELERDEKFPGGSRKVEGYAVEKVGVGQYTLALKITEEFSLFNTFMTTTRKMAMDLSQQMVHLAMDLSQQMDLSAMDLSQ